MTERSLGPGFKVGHFTNTIGHTGCTVVLPPAGNVTSCDVRGSSPGSRELMALDLDRRLTEVHAILLTGGSAFGLAAADGVVLWLSERGLGYKTPLVAVPIVPAAVIFDAAAGDPETRPGPEAGRAACEAARPGPIETGAVGAGTGATVGKWAGIEHAASGGLGFGRSAVAGATVAAIAVVNAVGDVVDEDGRVLAGSAASPAALRAPRPKLAPDLPTNTVLALLAIHAHLDKQAVRWLAGRGSDGVTIAVRPAHTRYDGDCVFAVAAPPADEAPASDLDLLGVLATEAVAGAVRDAVTRRGR